MTDVQTSVLNNIKTIAIDTSLTESFIEMVLLRLESLGYELKDTDVWSIFFTIKKCENHYKDFCNIKDIPETLYENLCDAVCGEFLLRLFSLGKLDDIQITQTLSSVHLGDTTVSYSTSGAIDKVALFTSAMNDLIHSKDGDLICYRKMTW